MKRILHNFIQSWLEFTEPLPTPEIFRLWTALGLISSALSRRAWLVTNSRMPRCYPNLYLMLVGPPGVGKDVAINKGADLIYLANKQSKNGLIARIGGESISPKGLIDRLADNGSKQTFTYKTKTESKTAEFHSLTFCIGELGTAIPEYDPKLIPLLNDLYNNKPSFEDTIRGIEVKVPNPHLVLILGNQPNTLAEVFPERTFRMGFTSRIIFVYHKDPVKKKLYVPAEEEAKWDTELEQSLASDFEAITHMTGQFGVTPEVKDLINDFNDKRPGEVRSNRFQDYNTRRTLHAQKLAMIISAAEDNRMVVETRHWVRALEYLFEAERLMPAIFAEVTTSQGFSETYGELSQLGDSNGEITYHNLVRKLSRTHPGYEVKQIIEHWITGGSLSEIRDEAGAPLNPKKYRINAQ